MARIRTVKPEFWSSEQIMELSIDTRLLFIGMWNFCDDGGNHPASMKTLKAEIFPSDNIDLKEIRRMLDELSTNNLLCLYENEGKYYFHVSGWHHQRIDRPLPKHPKYVSQAIDFWQFDECSTSERRAIDVGREGKGRESKVKESVVGSRFALTDPPEDWIQFCVTQRPDINPGLTFDSFRDYWIGVSGSKGVKRDWPATWRNWVRNQKAAPGKQRPHTKRPQRAAIGSPEWKTEQEAEAKRMEEKYGS